MNKPSLIVVTGSPASGKTTLAHILAEELNCPILSRDELKEGLLNTLDLRHNQTDKSIDLRVHDIFFDTIDLMILNEVSIVIEAAFQDHVWRPRLVSFLDKANIKIIVCKARPELIRARFTERFLADPDREKYHGDQALSLSELDLTSMLENYQPVKMKVPTLCVERSGNYHPTIENIVDFIRQKNKS